MQSIIDTVIAEVESVKNGEKNVLDVYPSLYELEKSIKELVSELKPIVIEEVGKYDRKEDVIKNGYKVSVVTTSRHSFKNDEQWESLKQSMKNREALMKKARAMAEKNQTLVDPESGEIVPPSEVKTSTYPKLEFIGQQL